MNHSQIQDLLHATLSAQANFDEKQLLKQGKIAKCAEQVLRRRRKSEQTFGWLFVLIIFVPICVQLVAAVFGPSGLSSGFAFGQLSFVALLQVPTLIQLRDSQTRIETLIALWLLDDNDNGDPDSSALAYHIFAAS